MSAARLAVRARCGLHIAITVLQPAKFILPPPLRGRGEPLVLFGSRNIYTPRARETIINPIEGFSPFSNRLSYININVGILLAVFATSEDARESARPAETQMSPSIQRHPGPERYGIYVKAGKRVFGKLKV
jgi:hypothetical protein